MYNNINKNFFKLKGIFFLNERKRGKYDMIYIIELKIHNYKRKLFQCFLDTKHFNKFCFQTK